MPPPGPPPRGVDLRRATAGRQIDPNRYETGITYHQLFVKVNEANDRSPRAQQVKQITMQMLQFVHKLLPTLKQMGIQIKVNQVFDKHLRNKRFTDTLKGRGITNLPALITHENVYIGVKEIQDLYYRNIRAFHSERAREAPNFSDMAPEDELEQFYANETGDDAWDEAEAGDMEEEDMGESSDMMDSYNRMLSRRERMNEARKGSGRRSGRQSERSERGTGRRGGRNGRRTQDANVGANADDFDMTMAQMIRDIDTNVVDEAFSGSGGDSYEDDGGNGNAQDDLMETAFWNNMMESV